ncbi:MAG TPA: AI-2E family transporter [Candidatus Limnocylindria bacterium]|nr:AI-2E family transporter [Candidatus Limnocylindria bacterium]
MPAGGLGRRERRWLLVFLVLGSAYFAVLLIGLLGATVANFSQILIVVFLAWLLAFVMSPLVSLLQDRLRLPRPLVVLLGYLVTLVLLGFVLFYTGSAVVQQAGELAEEFPGRADEIEAGLRSWQEDFQLGRLRLDLVRMFNTAQNQVAAAGTAIIDQAQAIAGVTVAALGSLVVIVILSLYMVLDAERIRGRLRTLVPSQFRDEFDMFERSVATAFGGFLRAQLLLAAIQAAVVGLVGTAFGVPYLFLVGTASALVMLIPFFGPPLALVPPIVSAAIFQPAALVPVAAILLVVQTVVVNWLQPRLLQGALGMHPILVLVGLLVGAQVAGVWGALFGIPVLAVLNVFFAYWTMEAVPNVVLPDRERLEDVQESTMVRVEKTRAGSEQPAIRVHRSLRTGAAPAVEPEMPEERPRSAPAD